MENPQSYSNENKNSNSYLQKNLSLNFEKLLSDRENLGNIARFLFKKILDSNSVDRNIYYFILFYRIV
jgi:hypothetical protein